jgi:[glutamine synthetase] adenylyltransferase / [glutamine synthetase]-adenylyl-L-tyrosine phosphorylase
MRRADLQFAALNVCSRAMPPPSPTTNVSDRWIDEKAAAAIFPERTATTLFALRESWPAHAPLLRNFIENFPLGEAALLHLFSVSSICATRVVNAPELLLWLAEAAQSSRGYGQMLADLRELNRGEISQNNFEVLRRWKGREMTRIALREVAEVSSIEETTEELSQLAAICLAQVFQHWNRELRNRFGSPDAEFAVLGLGKLGGRELNHSSDVDVIFLYSHEGQLSATLSYHEWFNRLSTKIVETFSATNPAGALFRIDLRLRPEGSAGPIARSLESMENYYSGFGETWERLALIRARGICGSEELVYEFLQQHQPFIYPKSPTPDLLDEIAVLKQRIERDVVGHENLDRDVKLGAGGIREIEFTAQALQLIHGARNTFLQETSTLKTLRALAQLELLPTNEVLALDAAYRFLRRVEHRLQIEAEQQTHTIPDEPDSLRRLALSLGFPSPNKMNAELRRHMGNVRTIFEKNISDSVETTGPSAPSGTIFRDETRAAKLLLELAEGPARFHVAPRTRQVFGKLRPLLLAQLAKTADPDATLNQLVRFVEAYGLRSMLFELLAVNPRLLELLTKIFDVSRHAGDLLVRHPQLLEEITRSRKLDQPLDVTEHLRRLDSLGAKATALHPVRTYRQGQWLRILLRDVLGLSNTVTLAQEHSALSEACLIFMNRLLVDDAGLTIIALGKFGGREITYGADLDVLFIGENTRAAQNLFVAMGKPTPEGTIAPLDTRLRPDGEKGPLVSSLSTYESYYENRAHLWELWALTRARPILGPAQMDFLQMVQRFWRDAGQRPNLFPEINSMTERIRRDRGRGAAGLDFKTGTGGMIEAEFLVQALQMRAGIWNPNWTEAVMELAREDLLAQNEASQLKISYGFLRRCEAALRRWENKSVSSLPTAEFEQRRLASWLGYKEFEAFVQGYDEARQKIHVLYARRIQS